MNCYLELQRRDDATSSLLLHLLLAGMLQPPDRVLVTCLTHALSACCLHLHGLENGDAEVVRAVCSCDIGLFARVQVYVDVLGDGRTGKHRAQARNIFILVDSKMSWTVMQTGSRQTPATQLASS